MKRVSKLRWAGALVAAVLFGLIAFVPTQTTRAENERIVTIYHDDVEQTIITDAITVQDALDRAEVVIGENDTVEPGLDTELTANSYSINVYRARPVVVIDGNQRYTVMTAHTSGQEIAAAAELVLYDEDTFTLTRIDDFINEGGVGLKLTIDRAVPITLTLYGSSSKIRTQAETVSQLLDEKGIVMTADDGASLPLGAPITSDMSLSVWRNGVQTITAEEDEPFTIRQIQDTDQDVGYVAMQQVGVNGKKLVTYEIEMRDGVEISRTVIQSVVTLQPTEQIQTVGAKAKFSGAISEALSQLRSCESGGNYANKNNPRYRGAYQFGYGTWANYGGYYDPADAPAAVQDQAAYELYLRRGWSPWPHCSAKLGLQDIYR